MKLIPVMTEKSMKQVKDNAFTFYVPVNLNKLEIKKIVEETFGVKVIKVKTINLKARTKRNIKGKMQKVKAAKKAIIVLKSGDKIDLFEEEKKPKKTKKTTKKAK